MLGPHPGVTGDPGAKRQHTVLLSVIWPRGGEGIKAFSWSAREMDSAGEAQKDMLVLRNEAAMSPSTEVPKLLQQWEVGAVASTRGQLGSIGCQGHGGNPQVHGSITQPSTRVG